jgi:hypothetical protein
MARLLRMTVATAFLISAGACASATAVHPPAASSAPPPALTVTLTRTGGFVGARDRVVIAPDGTWTRTDKGGMETHGRLSPDRITLIQHLAHEPDLAGETAPPTGKAACADGNVYAVNAGTVTVTYTDCGDPRPPVAAQMVSLISGWTLE